MTTHRAILGPRADGSQPGFYLREGASTDHWLIYLQGGGWVYDKPSAVSRSKGSLGSSADWPQTQEGSGMLSADPRTNPDLAHFNVAYFKYCDGFCFSGNNDTAMVHNGSKPVFFRGRRIVDRLLAELLRAHGLHEAKTVLLSGSSAGGLAVYMHADHVGSTLRAAAPALADYRAVADAGWFPDILDVDGMPGLRPVVQWASKLANSSGNEACRVTMRAGAPTPPQDSLRLWRLAAGVWFGLHAADVWLCGARGSAPADMAVQLLHGERALPLRPHPVRGRPPAIQKGTRVLISLWDSLMCGRVQGTRPNISESHSELRTRVPFCIALADSSSWSRSTAPITSLIPSGWSAPRRAPRAANVRPATRAR